MRQESEHDARMMAGTQAALDAVQMFGKGATFEAMRSDLVTARLTIRRAIAGDDADLEAAAGYIDATLAGLCPHDPATHHYTTADSGEELTTCTACGVSWFTGRRYGEIGTDTA